MIHKNIDNNNDDDDDDDDELSINVYMIYLDFCFQTTSVGSISLKVNYNMNDPSQWTISHKNDISIFYSS